MVRKHKNARLKPRYKIIVQHHHAIPAPCLSPATHRGHPVFARAHLGVNSASSSGAIKTRCGLKAVGEVLCCVAESNRKLISYVGGRKRSCVASRNGALAVDGYISWAKICGVFNFGALNIINRYMHVRVQTRTEKPSVQQLYVLVA